MGRTAWPRQLGALQYCVLTLLTMPCCHVVMATKGDINSSHDAIIVHDIAKRILITKELQPPATTTLPCSILILWRMMRKGPSNAGWPAVGIEWVELTYSISMWKPHHMHASFLISPMHASWGVLDTKIHCMQAPPVRLPVTTTPAPAAAASPSVGINENLRTLQMLLKNSKPVN